ncbi:MAG: TrkH family potassium uptake protein [Myxococcota bacterium]|nr:TrkH family potassium uptake protein [Myxococcota bacterium]
MNLRRVLHILGLLLFILAGAQLVPLVWCLVPGEGWASRGFAVGATLTALLGVAFRVLGSPSGELYRREGVLLVVGAWVLASITGALPYLASGVVSSPVDALFESASGFTTTGASILVDIEAAGAAVLFWRSFTQWLGGIGIVVLFVALLSELGPGARFLFKLEVPGPKAEILHSRVRETAVLLARIYAALTLIQVGLLLALGLSFYDALTHAFSTLSTGGFSPYQDSVSHFTTPVQAVILIFMLLAGINFSLYYSVLRQRTLQVLRDIELRLYLAIVVAVALVVGVDLLGNDVGPVGRIAFDSVFQVVSLLSTTGFVTADFDHWPEFSRTVLVLLMIIGGCAGSTAGGAKIIRLIVGWRAALREVRLTFSPRSVITVVVGGESVPEDSVRGVLALLLLWMVAWGAGTALLAVGDTGLTTAATAAIATLSNVGPGLAGVGPSESFAFFEAWQKALMILLMWLGRLEFFALLALFQPHFWRP